MLGVGVAVKICVVLVVQAVAKLLTEPKMRLKTRMLDFFIRSPFDNFEASIAS